MLRAIVRNWRDRSKAAEESRLPRQPWRAAPRSKDDVIARIPAGGESTNRQVTVYDSGGVVAGRTLHRPVPSSELQISKGSDVVALPRCIVVTDDGTLLRGSVRSDVPAHAGLLPLLDRYFATDRVGGQVERQLSEPVLIADSRWSAEYGHQLLEIVPTLLMRRYLPVTTSVLTSAPFSRTLLLFFSQMGVSADQIIQLKAPVRCAESYIADEPVGLRASMHPLGREAFVMVRRLAERSNRRVAERIFVSRSAIPSRRLREEVEVEALFERNGFELIHPEALAIEYQIAAFAGAKLIAGLGGSAMHNAVFADADTPVLILQTGAMETIRDIKLAEPGRRVGFVLGRSAPLGNPYTAPWTVDMRAVERALHLHFGI